MKNLCIGFVVLGMTIFGCQETVNDEFEDPDAERRLALQVRESDISMEEIHELTEEYTAEQEVSLDEVIDQIGGLERKGTALYFTSTDHMAEVAELLSTLSEDQLDEWEAVAMFNSQRRLNNKKMKSEDVDDFELEKQRINLRYVESLFDEEGVVYVDTMQVVYQGDKVFKTYSINTGKEINLHEFLNQKNTVSCNDCRQGKFQYCDRYFYNGNYKVVGTKWNEGYAFYASVGFRTKYYLKNHKGKWKNAYAPSMLGANLDQWHHVQICDGLYGSTNYSSIKKEKYNAPHHVEKVITSGLFRSNYCVPHFGRVHHWKDDDYNNDAHCEPWNW